MHELHKPQSELKYNDFIQDEIRILILSSQVRPNIFGFWQSIHST